MQVKYTGDVTIEGKVYSRYAVIDGPADNAWHLFDALVNVDDLDIYVRGVGGSVAAPVLTNGKAKSLAEMTFTSDGQPLGMQKRVTGPSVRSYVGPRAGRLTAQANGVGVQVPNVTPTAAPDQAA